MRQAFRQSLSLLAVFALLGAQNAVASPDAKTGVTAVSGPDAEFFESKVRPILVNKCQQCHGPEKDKGGLRLDSRQAALKGGDNGPAVVPGHPEQSRLIEAIGYEGDTQMPPKGQLKKAEIETLNNWVKRGAPWPAPAETAEVPASKPSAAFAERIKKGRDFWAFRPVEHPAPPAVKKSDWPQGSIDRFILAQLESKGLTPSRPADRQALIRRVTFDVIGLPPTPKEVDAFVNDKSPDAFAKVVNRLLNSPHYGERWGRHWLDLARYGEDQAHSFQPRLYPNGYRYRDWVTSALNSDLPYNRFLLEQIAGDLIDEPGKQERLPALGFFALGPVYYGDAKKHDQVDDRIDTLTRGVLGLTVACARCHDHKYDPIPTTDYYALAGIFHSTDYREAPLAPKDVVDAYDKAAALVETRKNEIARFQREQAQAITKNRVGETSRYVLAVWKLMARRGNDTKQPVKAAEIARAEGLDPGVLDAWVKYLSDENKIKSRPSLAGWRGLIGRRKPSPALLNDKAALAEAKAVADAIQSAVRGAVDRATATRQSKSAESAAPSQPAATIGTASLALVALPRVAPAVEPDPALVADLTGESGFLVVANNKVDSALDEAGRKRLKDLKAAFDQAKSAVPAKYPVVHALADNGSPINMRVLIRGNDATPGEKVPRRFLTILGGDAKAFEKGSGRLELARAIADPRNPLTARVFVNRVWQHYFGRGLVATASNFGVLGERPTHPELLDHLASNFVANGWSIKALHREILLSATYQQASDDNTKAMEIDPGNTLVWRMTRKRLEVEPWRDAMLAVSGRLDLKVGGASVALEAPDNDRRTYYAKISRHDLAPLLRLFDFPDPNITSAERTKTTVALQQLLVLNDEFLVTSAKGLVNRLVKSAATDIERIQRAYRILYAREPSSREQAIALAYLSAREPVDTAAKAPNDLSRWERYAQVLLASNEFLFLD